MMSVGDGKQRGNPCFGILLTIPSLDQQSLVSLTGKKAWVCWQCAPFCGLGCVWKRSHESVWAGLCHARKTEGWRLSLKGVSLALRSQELFLFSLRKYHFMLGLFWHICVSAGISFLVKCICGIPSAAVLSGYPEDAGCLWRPLWKPRVRYFLSQWQNSWLGHQGKEGLPQFMLWGTVAGTLGFLTSRISHPGQSLMVSSKLQQIHSKGVSERYHAILLYAFCEDFLRSVEQS